jgi:predicted RNA-binding protein (virulence factor B family)
MIEIGKTTTLTVARIDEPGAFLSDGEDNLVLLPSFQMAKGIEVGDELTVFIYTDVEENQLATTEKPVFEVNELALLEITDQTNFGAFANYGLRKELLIPNSQQVQDLEIGDRCLTYLFVDGVTKRLVGSTKLDNFLSQDDLTIAVGDEVDLIAWTESKLGVSVIINNKHIGLVYANSIFQPVKEGDKLKGYIKEIREDRLIDVTIQKSGYDNIEPTSKVLLEKLIASDGFLPFHDKSDPDSIKRQLHMSKKTFKKSAGWLFKHKMIRIENDGIHFVSTEPVYDAAKVERTVPRTKATTAEVKAVTADKPVESESEEPKASAPVKRQFTFKGGKTNEAD